MLCGLLVLLAVGAAAPEAATARGLDFHQCEREGHEEFECARMTVPLKLQAGRPRPAAEQAGTKRRRIGIHVERLKGTGDRPRALLALSGGPGQAATDIGPAFAQPLAPAYEGSHQFITIDQRGTGRSGFLECGALAGETSGRGAVAVRRCSRQVGGRARWYRTADSVADIQKLRRKLGVEQLSIFGVSYGTVVAAQFARTYPQRTESLILDSVFSGWDPLFRPSFEASGRVLRAFCADGACEGITDDPVGDTADLVDRAAAGLEGKVVDPKDDFRKKSIPIKRPEIFGALLGTDLSAPLRSLWPGSLAAAREGDVAPAARLLTLASAGADPEEGKRADVSAALNLATNCADTPNPWNGRISIPLRKRATGDLANDTPAALFEPFDRVSAFGGAVAAQCWGWRFGPQRGALTAAPLPDVPALLLEGEVDLRTPISTMERVAAELPRSATTIVANQGHSVLGGECAAASLEAWAAGDPVPARCEQPVAYPNQPAPATSLDDYRAPTRPERTFDAVSDTIFDDAVVVTDIVANSTRVAGGLRSGSLRIELGEPLRIELRGYSLVPGVRVSGELTAPPLNGELEVKGRAAAHGTVEFRDGELSGRLGDQQFERPSSRQERRRVAEAVEPDPVVPRAIP